MSDQSASEIEESVLTTPDGHALPRVLDKSITIDVVQRYVESERARNRRAMLWLGTVFLFVVLFVIVISVGISLYVMKNAKNAVDRVNEVEDKTIYVAAEILSVSNKIHSMTNIISTIEQENREILGEVEQKERSRLKGDKVLKGDLVKFRNWIVAMNSRELSAVEKLEKRLASVEKLASIRATELAAMREKYTSLLASVSSQSSDRNQQPEPLVMNSLSDEPDDLSAELPVDLSPDSVADKFADVDDIPPVVLGQPESEISVVTFPNGDKYEGEFRGGFFYGTGLLSYRNGDKYEGLFKNDMMHGKGIYSYKNGDRYEGDYCENIKKGKGRMFFRNGDRYIGEFDNDMINGKGTMIYNNGHKYAGDFKNGLKHGNGIFSFANGDIYEGDFVEGMRNGRGKYVYSNGAKYIGEFRVGRKHGSGRYIYPDGQEYRGQFKDGKKHGKGICVYPGGKQRKGEWKDDRFVRDI